MPFTLQRATIADVPEITDVFFNAFSDDFSRAMFPATEEMRKWWIETYTKDVLKAEAEGSKEVFLIVVESDSDSNVNNDDVNVNQEKKKRRIAAFGQWKLPLTTDEEKEKKRKQDSSAPIWPECSNRDLCSWYFGNSDIRHERLMGGRPHYYLDMLGTAPEYQGRGCASLILKWGLSRADEQGLEAYVSASPRGRPAYQKYGFEVKETEEVYPGVIQTFMIRSSRK